MTEDGIRAGIYCRLSRAVDGDTTKVADQEVICRALCEKLGWPVAEVYADNNTSAWQRNRKRKGWDRMLADIKDGRINAIAVYHGDRLVRHPWDLEVLLDLAESRGVKLASPGGTSDLGNRDDHLILRVRAAVYKGESDNTSRRTKRGHARRRQAGLVNSGGRGGRMFGFAKDGVTHVPGEAEAVREVFARVINGEGIRRIAADLAGAGWCTTAGKPMHPLAVRRMLASPRYAGLMPDGVSAAAWEPIVSREDWETAAAVIGARSGMLPPGHNARRYLLSGIAKCGACGAPLQALTGHTAQWTGKPQAVATTYACRRRGCQRVTRSQVLLDAYVTRRVVNLLANPANPAGRVPSLPGLASEWRALADERAAVEAAIMDHTKGRVHLLMARLDSLDARMAELRELTAADAGARLLGSHAGITMDAFTALPLGVRRALVSAAYQVTVLPASKRGPGFRPEDTVLVRRGDAGEHE